MMINVLIRELANVPIGKYAVSLGVTLVILCFSLKSFGQTPFSNVEIHPKNEWGRFTGIPIVDEENNTVNIGLVARKYLLFLKYDYSGNLLSETNFDRPNKLNDEVLGYSISENHYNIFFSNVEFDQIRLAQIDKQNSEATYSEMDIDLKKKYVLSCFTHENEFYLITMLKASSEMQLYKYSNKGIFESYDYDFSKYDAFFDGFSSLAKILNTNYFASSLVGNITKDSSPKLEVIDENTPISIEKASKSNKIYQYGDKLIISMDHISDKSMFIEIDLTSFEFTLKSFLNTSSQLLEEEISTNSFLWLDQLFQLTISDKNLIIDVHNYKNKSFLKSFLANKYNEIEFQNGDFIKEGNVNFYSGVNDIVVKNQKIFFQKINASSIGMYAKENNGSIELRIGGFNERTISNSYHSIGGGNPFSGYSSFVSSSISKAFYFRSLLDSKTLIPKQEKLDDSYHDLILRHMKSIEIEIEGEAIYKLNGHYYFGYYDYYANRYIITEF